MAESSRHSSIHGNNSEIRIIQGEIKTASVQLQTDLRAM